MSLAIGIDLGTTNSCVAVVRDGKARVIQDRAGVALQPSIVSFHPDGRTLVGTEAADRRVIDPQNTFFSVKRLIGRDFTDPDVRRVADRYPYTLVEGPNRVPLAQARGKEYTLPEISSIILRLLGNIAVEATAEPLAGAVITVPANFNDVQRSSTRVSGRIAGLDVLRILNEPTAAALAYGYGQGLSERIAVYDFGGGTFDITILDLRENVFEVMATAGDMFLGGDDLDARMVDQMVASFLQLHHVDLRENPIALQRLRSVGEQIKCQLSSRMQVSARIRELEYGPGGKPLDMNFSITREAFEQRVGDLIERTFTVCDEAFRLAQLSPSQLDNILLVGGTTRIPMIRSRVTEYFGRQPRIDINPDEVVAIGAAIQAFALVGQQPTRTSVAPPPLEIGRPIGAAPDPEVMGLDEVSTAVAGAESSPPLRKTQRGYSARTAFPEDDPTLSGVPQQVADGLSAPDTGSAAAAVFGGAVSDDEKTGRHDMRRGLGAAAAAFGGEVPDDLPSPRTPGSTDASWPVPPSVPGSDPSQATTQRRTPSRRMVRASDPGSSGSAAAAAFGGDVPDDLPSPRLADGVRPGPGTDAYTSSEPSASSGGFASGEWSGSGNFDSFASGEWSGAHRSIGFSEESMMGAFTEDLKAPAAIGRPPPSALRQSSGGAAPPPFPMPVPGGPGDGLPPPRPPAPPQQDMGQEWNVLSVPGSPKPQVTPLPVDYVDSAVPVRALPVPPMGKPGAVRAPGVAPLPKHLLDELGVSHILIDVTPRSLAVQTVQGYCDTIIERNSPIPIEQTRVFTTSQDNQTAVVIRIAQGESRRVEENTVLGEVALSNIRSAPRGEVRIAVTFEIDTDGIIDVHARDLDTGQAADTKVTIFGGLSEAEVRELVKRYGRQ